MPIRNLNKHSKNQIREDTEGCITSDSIVRVSLVYEVRIYWVKGKTEELPGQVFIIIKQRTSRF